MFAHLFYYGDGGYPSYALMPVSTSDPNSAIKVLWVFRGNPSVGGLMGLSGTMRNSPNTLQRQSFKDGGGKSFPSDVRIPTPGCWDLQVQSGDVTATFTVVVASGQPGCSLSQDPCHLIS